MGETINYFRNIANTTCRVHGYGISLEAIMCVKLSDEIDTLYNQLKMAKKRMIALVEYRRRINPLNFQLEKLDDYIGDIEIFLSEIKSI